MRIFPSADQERHRFKAPESPVQGPVGGESLAIVPFREGLREFEPVYVTVQPLSGGADLEFEGQERSRFPFHGRILAYVCIYLLLVAWNPG